MFLIWHYLVHPQGRILMFFFLYFLSPVLKPVSVQVELFFFSPTTVLCFCPKSSAVSTQPPGISLLPLLSNDSHSFLCSQPEVGGSSQQTNTSQCRQGGDPGKIFLIYRFIHAHPKDTLSHTRVSNFWTLP